MINIIRKLNGEYIIEHSTNAGTRFYTAYGRVAANQIAKELRDSTPPEAPIEAVVIENKYPCRCGARASKRFRMCPECHNKSQEKLKSWREESRKTQE